MVAILALPGLLLAFCLGFRMWDAAGLCVPLGVGVLGIAIEVSARGGFAWGLPLLGSVTACLAVAALACSAVWARIGRRPLVRRSATRAADGATWGPHQHWVAGLSTMVAVVVGVIVVARGFGTPHTLNQTWDGAFHINSINLIAQRHLASPGILNELTNPGAPGGFYPPVFAAVGALLMMYTPVGPATAANLTALVIVALWPLAVSIAVRRIARPTSFGYAMAMVASITVGLFPALLMEWGTVWPNALSYLLIPAALVVLLRLLGLDRSSQGLADPHGRLVWWRCLAVMAIALPGLVLAHPGALFVIFYLMGPALFWILWRKILIRVSRLWLRAVAALGVCAGIVGLFVGVGHAAYRINSIDVVRQMTWPPQESWRHSLARVVTLSSELTSANLAMAALVLAGIYAAAQYSRGRFLIACYAILVAVVVMADSIQTNATMFWTGYWYNDPFRLFALLPLIAVPLIAMGADMARSWVRAGVDFLVRRRVLRLGPTAVGMAAGLVVCLGVVALQGGLGTRRISDAVSVSYTNPSAAVLDGVRRGFLVTPGEEEMFARLRTKLPPGTVIAGNPFTGAILAGAVSGEPSIYQAFGIGAAKDLVLVAAKFNQYQSDPAVCAAVERLHVGVVVTGSIFFQADPVSLRPYAGFDHLGAVPGLTQIDSGGGAAAYLVGSCRK